MLVYLKNGVYADLLASQVLQMPEERVQRIGSYSKALLLQSIGEHAQAVADDIMRPVISPIVLPSSNHENSSH
jgi:hypothetical protein